MGKKPTIKAAKGTRDFHPDQMMIREGLFSSVTDVFKRHGAVTIDTPVFELKETLTGKYGEDSKLIYDLQDQGGELLALRYDLTVPFARYVAQHGVQNIKRYAIAKVYRRDNPAMARGRFREFFQCDFDVAGSYAAGVPDAEAVAVMAEVLDSLALRGEYAIKVSHRGLLDALLAEAGVPEEQRRGACSAIDKLDKEPWDVVRDEMVKTKGIPEEVVDRIEPLVRIKSDRGAQGVLQTLETLKVSPLAAHAPGAKALEELELIVANLQAMDRLDAVVLDLSLARGLDYYTGIIYETVLTNPKYGVGSVAAGGRYDDLIGMFSSRQIPAVGCSIGIERLYNILEAKAREDAKNGAKPIRETETQVLVASIGNGLQHERMKIAAQLWKHAIPAEFGYKPNPKMGDQLNAALKQGIPFLVLFGNDELEKGVVKIKDLAAEREETVTRAELVPRLCALLGRPQPQGADVASVAEQAGRLAVDA